jgi:ABC-type lipoprotein release transport system permease subunit
MRRFLQQCGITVRLAFRNIFRNKRRTIVTLLAVIFGVGSTIALAAIARGLSHQLVEDSIYNLTGHLKVQDARYKEDPAAEYFFSASREKLAEMRRLPGVLAVLPRVRLQAVVQSEREARSLTLVGIESKREATHSIAGAEPSEGRQLQGSGDDGVIVGESFLNDMQSAIGRRVVFMGQSSENELVERGVRIVGAFSAEVEATEKQYAFIGRTPLQEMLGLQPDEYHEISVIVKDQSNLLEIQNALQEIFPDLDVQNWRDLQPLVVSMTKIQSGFLIIWFVIVVISAGFGLVNSLLMSIFERIRELAVMNALGMSRGWIITETVLQSFLLLTVGGLSGVLFGLGIVQYFSDGIDLSAFAEGASSVGIGSTVIPVVLMGDITSIVGLLILLGTAGCLYPAWQAAQVDPSRALQRL